jgi:hypothetical protein
MSLTTDTRHWHEQYERSSSTVQEAIDAAFKAAWSELASRGYSTATDDRAEKLIAAIMEYFTESAEE